MKFSVLMSVYKNEKQEYLYDAIESVLNQTIKPDEVVIVKDGPLTKELDDVIDKFIIENKDIIKVVELEENKGLGIALNIGVQSCSYDIIARMDTDDICKKDRFEKQLNQFKNNKDLDIVGSWIDEFEGSIDMIVSTRKTPETSMEIYKYAKARNPFNHMTVMYKKKSVINSGNYIDLLWNEDYYLWVRMIVNNSKMYNIQESLVYARTGNDMFARRGGYRYAVQDIKLQKEFYKLGFVNLIGLSTNIIKRSLVRLIPNKLRKIIYIKILRK